MFGIREAALTRPDGNEIAARLVAGLTRARPRTDARSAQAPVGGQNLAQHARAQPEQPGWALALQCVLHLLMMVI
jgi:hypothetical protein